MTIEQLEEAILSEVVTRFVNLKQSTSRRALVIKFRGQPASHAIANLSLSQDILRRTANTATVEEEYLPSAAAFQLCGNMQFRDQAKFAVAVVLHALQEMYVGEHKKEGFAFEDLKHQVELIYPNKSFDDETLKLGLYLAQDFGVFMGLRLNEPANTEVVWFQIGENPITMPDPEREWDRVMAGYRRPVTVPSADIDQIEKAFRRQGEAEWERIGEPLGGGGQSDVFLVRSPARVAERASCLKKIRKALDEDKRAELAEAISAYSRPESPSELGALKVFKIPPEGETLTPKQSEAIERLKNEITVLNEGRPGLPKLLDSNIKQRWIVTEYFPEGTLERHLLRYRGKAVFALSVFRTLVETVTALHKDGYVHRDIKPPNVFVRSIDELVLGDFGIVYLPSEGERVTRPTERVGPRDYIPQWANLGTRYETVEPCFDVYMLGKLLWSMVDGRTFLPREYHHYPEFDLTKTFPDDPHMFLINRILDKCWVEDSSNCLHSAQDLLLMTEEIVRTLERGGQLLSPGVPRPCHVCGRGSYQLESLGQGKSVGSVRLWIGGSDTVRLSVGTYICDSCGHVEFFKTAPQ